MAEQKNWEGEGQVIEKGEELSEGRLVEGEELEKLEKLHQTPTPPTTIVLEENEQKKFLHLGELDKAWQELLSHSQNDIVKQRKAINSEVNEFWKVISKKYNLGDDKNYRINPATGEITETPFPAPAKGVQQ